ncbi:MAG: tRNA uracil 4-sulfurtransferase ThiI [Bacillota bacterium]
MKRLLIKYASEITLKGLNRRMFEELLIKNIKKRIGVGHRIEKESGRMYIDTVSESMAEAISKTFGIISVAEAEVVEKDIPSIAAASIEQIKKTNASTFKVETKRADKKFPVSSMEVSRQVGAEILKSIDDIKVDVHNPECIVNVEIRDKGYVYTRELKGVGGMPYKSSGKGMLLLSGGIDSPVAGYMLARRGMELTAVYYHSHPYTSERAKEKVIELARRLSEYTGSFKLYIVPFTDIQMNIIEKCREDELTIIMRRFMMRIAEEIAEKEGAMCLITGESLGQVASQTLESLYVTNSDIDMPVFRPLIGMDKVDIVDIAREIETYETSILPYEDCCTIFVPKHPKTKPKLGDIRSEEQKLDVENLIKNAIENAELIEI